MKITIIGASKGVGLETVKRALNRGHHVSTFSRTKLPLPSSEKLNQIYGDARNKKDVQQALNDFDALIISLGTGKSTKATTLFSSFAKVLLSIHAEKKIEVPVIVLTGFGAGESWTYNGFLQRIVFNLLLKKVYEDKTLMETLITKSDLPWEIIRPGLLNNKELTEGYRIETVLRKGMKLKTLSRANVADFMVKQAENPTMLKQYVTLSGK